MDLSRLATIVVGVVGVEGGVSFAEVRSDCEPCCVVVDDSSVKERNSI